jgi:hypothetical protein
MEKRFTLRIEDIYFETIVRHSRKNNRSINAEIVTLCQEALQARANTELEKQARREKALKNGRTDHDS